MQNLPQPLFVKEGRTRRRAMLKPKHYIAAAGFYLAAITCWSLSDAADRVRFAYPAKSLNYLPVTLGREKGIYQAEGIDLQMVLVASTIQVTALTTGDIDFSGAQSQVMAGAARGLPVKVIGFLTIKPSFWLVAKPEIKSIPELKNKIIGITAIGSSTDTLARYVLVKNGLTPDRESRSSARERRRIF